MTVETESTVRPSTATTAKPPRRRRRVLLWAGVGVLVVLIAGGWLAWRAEQIRTNLTAARAALATARSDVLNGGDQTAAVLATAQHHTAAARRAADDPLWSLLSHVPVAGNTLRSAAGVAQVSDRLTQRALPVLVDAANQLRAVRAAPGAGVPLDTVEALAAPLSGVQDELASDAYAIAHLPTTHVIHQVTDAQTKILADLKSLAGPVDTAATAARLAPGMLGASGPRRYFVAFE